MLLTNQRLDKLAAARVDFVDRGMLLPTALHPQQAWMIAAGRSGKSNKKHEEDSGDDDDDSDAVEMVEGNVVLARKRSKYQSF